MITLEDWALTRRLVAEGVPKARVAQRLGVSRTTVVKAVASDAPPRYERRAVPTSFAPFEVRVRVLLEDDPDLKMIAGKINVYRERVEQGSADELWSVPRKP